MDDKDLELQDRDMQAVYTAEYRRGFKDGVLDSRDGIVRQFADDIGAYWEGYVKGSRGKCKRKG